MHIKKIECILKSSLLFKVFRCEILKTFIKSCALYSDMGLVGMGSAEPINFERRVLEPINFLGTSIETHIMIISWYWMARKLGNIQSPKKASNPSIQIPDGTPALLVWWKLAKPPLSPSEPLQFLLHVPYLGKGTMWIIENGHFCLVVLGFAIFEHTQWNKTKWKKCNT